MINFFNESHMMHCNEEESLKYMIVQQLVFSRENNPSSSFLLEIPHRLEVKTFHSI